MVLRTKWQFTNIRELIGRTKGLRTILTQIDKVPPFRCNKD